MVEVCIKIFGRVQGVFFRVFVMECAQYNNVRGWVKNDPDGTVSALLQGDKSDILAVLDKLKVGPQLSKVTKIDETWSENPERKYNEFRII
jgi:acylphosphatase